MVGIETWWTLRTYSRKITVRQTNCNVIKRGKHPNYNALLRLAFTSSQVILSSTLPTQVGFLVDSAVIH